jgi:hypothetical protein
MEDRLILIGSGGRNSGKTFLAVELIKRLKKSFRVNALKITGIERRGGVCPRGGEGCGACKLDADFCLTEELDGEGSKDTSLLLKAGAEKVFWLRCLRSALRQGYGAFAEKADGDAIIICESNSLREVAEPALFVMIEAENGAPPKPSAAQVAAKADITMRPRFSSKEIEELLARIEGKIRKQPGAYH